jgi:cell wall-associated NlpC family hydrolase
VHTPLSVRRIARHRGAAVTTSLLVVGVLATTGGTAAAAPQPTVAQVQQKLSKLNAQADRLGQQFIQVKLELASANQRLKLVNRQSSRYQAQFDSMRTEIGQIAAAAYKGGNMNSSVALLTSGNAQQMLNQSSILTELSSVNGAQMHQFIGIARHLTATQETARRARGAILALRNSLSKRRQALSKLIDQQKALLAQLTPPQQVGTGPGGGSSGGGGGKPPVPHKGPVGSQAQQAVAYAYSKIGDPYVWGASGPSAFDCSGLTSAAWASAGISIPRISYDQISSLPSVPLNALQPGDILGFSGNSHVGLYVGNNQLIDAPTAGSNVELISLSGWYAQTLDAAVRP